VLALGLSFRRNAVRDKTHRLPGIAQDERGDARYLLRLSVWAMGTVIAPVILFPAFGQEVNLVGIANSVWMGIFAAAAVSLAATRAVQPLWSLARGWRPVRSKVGVHRPWAASQLATLTLAVVVLVAIGNALLIQIRQRNSNIDAIVPLYTAGNQNLLLEPLRNFSEGYFMTNINTPTIYFYVERPGFGVCGLNSIGESGEIDLDDCKIAFMRDRKRYGASRPSYFFQFSAPGYFPGFADCMPTGTLMAELQEGRAPAACFAMQEGRLRKHYPAVFKNALFAVYDLRINADQKK
jgi:hypothetical protein